MQTAFRISCLSVLLSMALPCAGFAEPPAAQNPTAEKPEAESPLFIENDATTHHCRVIWHGALVQTLECASAYTPTVIASLPANGKPFEHIFVVQENPMGNACNGGPVHVIGTLPNKSARVIGAIDFCGGPDPIVTQGKDEITITFPGGKPNHGEGIIPEEKWHLRGDKLTKNILH